MVTSLLLLDLSFAELYECRVLGMKLARPLVLPLGVQVTPRISESHEFDVGVTVQRKLSRWLLPFSANVDYRRLSRNAPCRRLPLTSSLLVLLEVYSSY